MLPAVSDLPPIEPPESTPLRVPRSLKALLSADLDPVARYGLIVAALTGICTIVGIALSPYLLAEHPLLLVMMSPIPRHMLLAAPRLDLGSYLAAGFVRRVFSASGGVCLGLRFGEGGIAWAEQHDGQLKRGAAALRWAFKRVGLLVVFVSPNPFVAATAVAMGKSPRAVLATSAAGHVSWLLIWYRFGDLAREFIAPITEFFQRYTWQSTAVCVVFVALTYGRRFRRQRPQA